MSVDADARVLALQPSWVVVLERELHDLWVGGRALVLCLAFSVLVSVLAYLAATNQALNFLEQRESVNLVVQVGMIVGALLTLLAAADAISGERERGTLESLLVTPLSRRKLVGAKLLAALSLWLMAYAILVPYAWFLARDLRIVGTALAASFVVGTLLACFLASLGLLVSLFASSNRSASP
jgi:ABC-2 type transport system permease protein